jgi:hypothetical protein
VGHKKNKDGAKKGTDDIFAHSLFAANARSSENVVCPLFCSVPVFLLYP